MLNLSKGSICFSYDFCQQCSVCQSVCPKQAITLSLLPNGLQQVNIAHDKCVRCLRCVKCCPANRGNAYTNYFDEFPQKEYALGGNADPKIRRASSSGGVCKTLIIEGLKNGWIDGVYSLQRTSQYPYAEGAFYTHNHLPDYEGLPNSVYHSVGIGTNLHKLKKCSRLMLVGTSCQLTALEKVLKGKYDTLIKVCIFCKQQKTLDSTRFLAKIMGTQIPQNLQFSTRYRGDGWPGIVKVNESELPYSRAAQIPFGRRLWTVPGCNICGDPFGIHAGADITLMDPWIIRKPNELGETLVIVHSQRGKELLVNTPNLTLTAMNYPDVAPALGLTDIRRKQQLIPFFKGMPGSNRIKWAGRMEQLQRKYLQAIVTGLPRMPILFYRILCKTPDLRNLILK